MRRYRTIVMDSAQWEGFEFRDDDIVISTPPKCGTTWVQMITALLVFQSPDLPAPLDQLSPWLDQTVHTRDEVFGQYAAQGHRRFIKTHTPLDGLPFDERVTYVCVARDPRDAAVSWMHHFANLDMDAFFPLRTRVVGMDDIATELMAMGPPPELTESESFAAFMEAPPGPLAPSLEFLTTHLQSFWDKRDLPNVVLLHYSDLKADLAGQMEALAGRLGIAVPPARWDALVAAAAFDSMRQRAAQVGPNMTTSIWKDPEGFFHSGSNGQWQGFMRDYGDERYRTRLEGLVEPMLASWLHTGWLAADPRALI